MMNWERKSAKQTNTYKDKKIKTRKYVWAYTKSETTVGEKIQSDRSF
jgi:hypothetical protein